MNDASAEEGEFFVMSYFTSDVQQLHLAISEGGRRWDEVDEGRPILQGTVGARTLRDPFVDLGRDGRFHLLATNGWASRSIVHATSTDLLEWSEQRLIPVMESVDGASNAWAPEFFAERDGDGYSVIWSSTVDPSDDEIERWPDDEWRSAPTYDQRIWASRTSDFVEWSDARLFFDPGYSVIDASVHVVDDRFLMAFKDERGSNHERGKHKGIRLSTFTDVRSGFTAPSAILSGDLPAEGPTLFRSAAGTTMIYDRYLAGSLGAMIRMERDPWVEVVDWTPPTRARHPTVRPIAAADYARLKAYRT